MKYAIYILVVFIGLVSCKTNNLSEKDRLDSALIVDTDAGEDDLMAIAFLLSRNDVHLEAITISNGLAHVKQGALNVKRLLALADKNETPVFLGAPQPLNGQQAFPAEWRKIADELPGVTLPEINHDLKFDRASDYLKKRLTSQQKQASILALGPLTNIAKVIQSEPQCLQGISEIVLMGGAFKVPGNVFDFGEFKSTTKTAEWNLFIDPTAAKTVLESGVKLRIIPLDATNKVQITLDILNEFQRASQTKLGRFVGEILQSVRNYIESGFYYAWDPLAAAALLEEEVVSLEEISFEIEASGPNAGQIRKVVKGKNKAQVAFDADQEKFMNVFLGALTDH